MKYKLTRRELRAAILDTVPMLSGYLVLGLGFGMILRTRGCGPGWALLMSGLIYAGSLQYVAIGLMTGGASLVTTALTALSPAVMAMLVVYCLRGTDFPGADHGVPTVLACGVTVALHMRKRSTLLSILGGTGCYMLLVQLVF